MCTKGVVVESVNIPPGCLHDMVVSVGRRGTLTYPCDGDGPASVTFGARTMKGAMNGDRVDACIGTEYRVPNTDDCAWQSAQRLRGTLAAGQLHYTYGEAPKSGQGGCWPPCNTSATVRVE
jgi:hypothetical protein